MLKHNVRLSQIHSLQGMIKPPKCLKLRKADFENTLRPFYLRTHTSQRIGKSGIKTWCKSAGLKSVVTSSVSLKFSQTWWITLQSPTFSTCQTCNAGDLRRQNCSFKSLTAPFVSKRTSLSYQEIRKSVLIYNKTHVKS